MPLARVQIGAQIVPRYAGLPFDVEHLVGRRAPRPIQPLPDVRLRDRMTESVSKSGLTARIFNGPLQGFALIHNPRI